MGCFEWGGERPTGWNSSRAAGFASVFKAAVVSVCTTFSNTKNIGILATEHIYGVVRFLKIYSDHSSTQHYEVIIFVMEGRTVLCEPCTIFLTFRWTSSLPDEHCAKSPTIFSHGATAVLWTLVRSRPALGPNRQPIHWVPRALSPRVWYSGRTVKLTTHLQLVPRSKDVHVYIQPPYILVLS
jgi:hypothetical protein